MIKLTYKSHSLQQGLFTLKSSFAINIDFPKIVTQHNKPKKNNSPSHLHQGNNDSPTKCFKVMASQCLLANNDSPESIKVKFEHRSAIQI